MAIAWAVAGLDFGKKKNRVSALGQSGSMIYETWGKGEG